MTPRIAHAASSLAVNIEVQGSGTTDNAVRRGESVPCQIRFISSTTPLSGSTVRVVLTSPTDAISFDGSPPGRNQLPIDLPTNGDRLTFRVTGRKVGIDLNNAAIHAHKSNAYTGIAGSARLTVYDIVTYVINVERGADYSADTFQDNGIDYFRYGGNAEGFKAAHLYARAEVKPSGVPGNVSGIEHLRVALVQNVSDISVEAKVSNPVITSWNPNAPRGVTAQFPTHHSHSFNHAGRLTDASLPAGEYAQYGLYVFRRPNFPSVQPINSMVHTYDTPGTRIQYRYNARTVDGTMIAQATYSRRNIKVKSKFRTYVVLFDTNSHISQAKRETGWRLNADSSYQRQRIVPEGRQTLVRLPPITSPPFAIDEARRLTIRQEGSNLTFRKPY